MEIKTGQVTAANLEIALNEMVAMGYPPMCPPIWMEGPGVFVVIGVRQGGDQAEAEDPGQAAGASEAPDTAGGGPEIRDGSN